MRVYEIRDAGDGGTMGFKPTKREAVAEAKWWQDQGDEVEVIAVVFTPTRAGICKLLDRYRPIA